jgi:DNA-binding MarR family transcriptional regulator
VLVPQTQLTTAREGDRRSAGQADEVFALVARHPLVTRQQLALLLGTSSARIARLVAELIERGWVRPISSDDLPQRLVGSSRDPLRRLGLVELTAAGRQEAARRLLVRAGLARRRHGLVRGEAARTRFLRQLHHTLGANAFFVDVAVAARRATRCGGDEALVDWRAAAACARGRCRPDGYGCYRRGPYRFGFFLEYDRGTERPGQHAAKLAAYYRYRASGAYTRDYEGFPTLLVVTTDEAAEARFAHQAHLAQQYGGVPLLLFLTTTARIQAHPEGGLGPVWRRPGPAWAAERAARVAWLPSLAPAGARLR